MGLRNKIIIILLLLLSISSYAKEDYFLMTSTGYTNHKICIADKWRDGKTAMNTQIRKGVVAINVRLNNNKWIINSILNLGQKIHIEGLGEFKVEDTGTFTGNAQKDKWNIDIYFDTLEEAKNWGVKLVKVFVIGG